MKILKCCKNCVNKYRGACSCSLPAQCNEWVEDDEGFDNKTITVTFNPDDTLLEQNEFKERKNETNKKLEKKFEDIATIDIDKLEKGIQYTFVDTGDVKLIIDNDFIMPQILLFTTREKYNWNLSEDNLRVAKKYLGEALEERKEHKNLEKKLDNILSKYEVVGKLADGRVCGFTLNAFNKIEICESCDDCYFTELSKDELLELSKLCKDIAGFCAEIERSKEE